MPDEVQSAGRENLDVGHAVLYDVKEDARAAEEVMFLRSHGLTGGSTVVDIGAGTGQFALAACEIASRVVAVDVSPVMLDQLRAKADQTGVANLEVVEAGFLTYEHAGRPADVVYSRWALHHLPDLWKALALHRMRQMIRLGGTLRLSDIAFSFAPGEMEARLEAWAASLPARAAEGEWVRADIDEHIRDEHSTFTWLLEPMLERAGFEIVQSDLSGDGFYASYLALAR